MGTAQIAAHQIGLQLWEFTALLLDSFAIAAQSLVGAALGGFRPGGRAGDGLAGGALGRCTPGCAFACRVRGRLVR